MPPPLPRVHMSKWSVLSCVSLVPQKHVLGGGVPEKGPRPRRMRMFDLQSGLRKVQSGMMGTYSNVSALCSSNAFRRLANTLSCSARACA